MSTVSWTENGTKRTARWHSENGTRAPSRLVVVDDRISANAALRLAKSGSGLLWRGDFHNARQLMRAMERRLREKSRPVSGHSGLGDLFHAQREARSERAELLGKIVIGLEQDHSIPLRRAPDVRAACEHAYGESTNDSGDISSATMLVSLPELLGVIGAYQWHCKGIDIAALGARLHPAYGVFAPTRNEYIDLVAAAPMPHGVDQPVVFDIGTGTGVLAGILAQRGAREVLATDVNPRAVRCARDNMQRLGLLDRVRVTEADLWPHDQQRADVIVCNPPWLPGQPTSALELGIYDSASEVLHRFLGALADHLTPHGEGWLILSDLAEHLGLRTRDELLTRISDAGLEVIAKHETVPRHSRIAEDSDPLHAARARERTVLWRLIPGPSRLS